MNTQVLYQAPVSPVPGLIHTERGFFPDCLLRKEDVVTETDDAKVTATEFFIGTDLVRRDVNVALKPKALFEFQAQEF